METEQVCRTCLGSENLAPIFAREENHERYTVALFLTTGLQIEMNDGLPQSICKECRDLINIAIEFRNQGHKSEQTLLRWGFSRRTTHSLHQERMKEFYQHIDMKLSAKLNVKKESPDTIEPIEGGTSVKVEFEVKEEQLYENKIEYDAQPGSDDDHFEDSTFNELSLRKSYWSEDSFEFIEEPKTKSKIARSRKRAPTLDRVKTYGHLVDGPMGRPGPYKCKACGTILKNWGTFMCHAKKKHKGLKFMCEYCGKTFSSVTNLRRHGMAKHDLERTYRCRLCDHATLDSQKLKIHERREHTGEKPYVCDTCGNGFYNRSTIVHHMTVHLTARNIQCMRCPSTFRTKQDLQCHNARVHKPKGPRIECHICRKTYATKCNLRVHLFNLHGIVLPMRKHEGRQNKKVVTIKTEPESENSALITTQEFKIENESFTYTPIG